MTPGSLVLGLAERMIRFACRRLPEADRDERYREWTAELPAILNDPDIRPAPRRALRVLLFAADQHRGVHSDRISDALISMLLGRTALAVSAVNSLLGLVGIFVINRIFGGVHSFGGGVLLGASCAPLIFFSFTVGVRLGVFARRTINNKKAGPR